MKALTVHLPWAWAIMSAGKNVENRATAWKYRGPVAVHAGLRFSTTACAHPLIRDAVRTRQHTDGTARALAMGMPCCEPWGEHSSVRPDGSPLQVVHLILEDPRPLQVPVPWKGQLGLWDLPDSVLG